MNCGFALFLGKCQWSVELCLFYRTSTTAVVTAIGLSWAMINNLGLMTVVVEVIVSFFANFFALKFFIFKG